MVLEVCLIREFVLDVYLCVVEVTQTFQMLTNLVHARNSDQHRE